MRSRVCVRACVRLALVSVCNLREENPLYINAGFPRVRACAEITIERGRCSRVRLRMQHNDHPSSSASRVRASVRSRARALT